MAGRQTHYHDVRVPDAGEGKARRYRRGNRQLAGEFPRPQGRFALC